MSDNPFGRSGEELRKRMENIRRKGVLTWAVYGLFDWVSVSMETTKEDIIFTTHLKNTFNKESDDIPHDEYLSKFSFQCKLPIKNATTENINEKYSEAKLFTLFKLFEEFEDE